MKTLNELDRLHAAATAGEWTWEAVGEKDNSWCLGTEYEGEVVDFVAQSGSCENQGDPRAIVALHNAWPSVSARLRAAEAEVERLRGLVRWFLDGDDHTHDDDCGARGQHDLDVCRVAGCGDAECEGPHCTCDATEMRDRARAALGEP